MKILFTAGLVLTVFASQAQIQFWTRDEIVDKQLQTARKQAKLNMAYNYITSENWAVSDNNDYNEVFAYDKEGRKIAYWKVKVDWAKNKRYYQLADSFFYNNKGLFTGMTRYSPQDNGAYYRIEFKAQSVFDAKGRMIRMNFYGLDTTQLTEYYTYSYDSKGKVAAVSAFNPSKKKTYEWKLSYDPQGRITKVRATQFYGTGTSFTDFIAKYNASGQLISYTELEKGKQKENESFFQYDKDKRMTKRIYKTRYDYYDTLSFWYNSSEKLFNRSYLKYPRPKGHETAFAHEFLVYLFEPYKD